MEVIEKIYYRQITPSDFRNMYQLAKPSGGGGQTYIECAGINSDELIDFLEYAEISDNSSDPRYDYLFNAYTLDSPIKKRELVFSPRGGRANYRINNQTIKDRHPSWKPDVGFPEPKKDATGTYLNDSTFKGIIDNLKIVIIRSSYKKYYATFIQSVTLPTAWPIGIGLELMLTTPRGIININKHKITLVLNSVNPFGLPVSSLPIFSGLTPKEPLNIISYGAPGTGKSYSLKQKLSIHKIDDNHLERVTFYANYSNSQFVGTYKPTPDVDPISGESIITYKFIPGPFIRSYVNAVNNPDEAFVLVVEEINRANSAAVFGEIFQILDRNKGKSLYPISVSEDLKLYLQKHIYLPSVNTSTIELPDNLFIWATMNSADQGVYPMDTAFKRRWDFDYIDIDMGDKEISNLKISITVGGITKEIYWNDLRKSINTLLSGKDFKVNEDKLLGPFFLSEDDLGILNFSSTSSDILIDKIQFDRVFKNKILMYLFEDAVKHRRDKLFLSIDTSRFSIICSEYDKIGLDIFGAPLTSLI